MTVAESAGDEIEVDVWYEEGGRWKRFQDMCTKVDLNQLQRVRDADESPANTLEFTFAGDPGAVYRLSSPLQSAAMLGRGVSENPSNPTRRPPGIADSRREARKKNGNSVRGIHQFVNLQTVIADTLRDVEMVQIKIDRLLFDDADQRALRRDLSQRRSRCRWMEEKIHQVERVMAEAKAHITLRDKVLETRGNSLVRGEECANVLRTSCSEKQTEVDAVENERVSLLPTIHHWRTHHIQNLDTLFPISPLHPPSLLYTILGVPLPIPTGPKDPAPPVSLALPAVDGIPHLKIDERTTSAALGYVAMVVQLLGNLGGTGGGLAYPVTCAGSRSLVKDVVSVMQGTRFFPLYAKGVERYRYEYAVFLLDKNIEMLMQESNIRLVDMRHTLPNLKNLLLTLSSPVPLPFKSPVSDSTTYIDSRASSRQTSYTWPSQTSHLVSPGSSIGHDSPLGSRARGINTPSPLAKARGKRSVLRASIGVARPLKTDPDTQSEATEETLDENGEVDQPHAVPKRVRPVECLG